MSYKVSVFLVGSSGAWYKLMYLHYAFVILQVSNDILRFFLSFMTNVEALKYKRT